jgi:CheY-like chemotaxis protein
VQDREEALRVGCDGYLTKPIQRRELISRVAHLLAERKPEA